jgi:hypothetical protein
MMLPLRYCFMIGRPCFMPRNAEVRRYDIPASLDLARLTSFYC